ncbi:MAG: ethanolamine ammonia-lyase subunit EutB [Planctomycetaceae bacterium]|nr:ethanolamine ammonia-lyase subunit EutB [Planctomycetaceae bacterium]
MAHSQLGLTRRRVLQTGLFTATVASLNSIGLAQSQSSNQSEFEELAEPIPHEDLVSYVHRIAGQWDLDLYRKVLGSANEYKEGDEIIGVAARSPVERKIARRLLEQTTLSQIESHPPFNDRMLELIKPSEKLPIEDSETTESIDDWTFGKLKEFLLESSEAQIQTLLPSLSSDVIACVVKLMSNQELIEVGRKVFNPLPGSKLGAQGYMGARIQPNSPTDHPEDIRWQVFNAFAYAVGDVLVGTNPVSSEPESVASVEATLKDVLDSFGVSSSIPHCVLAHIDIQAQLEATQPGSTALWFQSIAGSDAANGTFDVTVDKMMRHAQSKSGKFGLYFETGQGADFTNGHGFGTDMLIHESRKYGLARSLSETLMKARQIRGEGSDAWVHLNDVAGFIGPEVFRNREQLVRCCLEDIVMGKLHGLMIGLDVCTTLHMDVSLDDLGWCIDQIMPANPGYLMALPTRIDPMLGYLTTGYHDHVHIRQKFGYRVNDAMWEFFKELGVIDRDGQPTEHFGDPSWVYLAYCRRKSDPRSDQEILTEAKERIAQVRDRGVFISEGHGLSISVLAKDLDEHIHRIYDDAKKCIWAQLPEDFEASIPGGLGIKTLSKDRNDYILHPVSGESLHKESIERLEKLKAQHGQKYDTLLVLSDGLNALANTTGAQARELVEQLRIELASDGRRVVPELFVIRSGRVRAGYRLGETMFAGREGPLQIVHVVGERPGSGHRTLSIYITSADGGTWSQASKVDHNITKVVSGIAHTALVPKAGAQTAARILRSLG